VSFCIGKRICFSFVKRHFLLRLYYVASKNIIFHDKTHTHENYKYVSIGFCMTSDITWLRLMYVYHTLGASHITAFMKNISGFLDYSADGGNRYLRQFNTYVPVCTASHPRDWILHKTQWQWRKELGNYLVHWGKVRRPQNGRYITWHWNQVDWLLYTHYTSLWLKILGYVTAPSSLYYIYIYISMVCTVSEKKKFKLLWKRLCTIIEYYCQALLMKATKYQSGYSSF
jgi:hypothetical protein